MVPRSVFVDESKNPSYVVVGTYVEDAHVNEVRRVLRAQLMAGQRRLHFKSESPQRRRTLLAVIRTLPAAAHVYVGPGTDPSGSRRTALAALVAEARDQRVTRLVIESDDSVAAADRRLIALCLGGAEPRLDYAHVRPHDEPILWISDAVAWAWQHHQWRRRVAEIVVEK